MAKDSMCTATGNSSSNLDSSSSLEGAVVLLSSARQHSQLQVSTHSTAAAAAALKAQHQGSSN
jgi:hypothetical protein